MTGYAVIAFDLCARIKIIPLYLDHSAAFTTQEIPTVSDNQITTTATPIANASVLLENPSD